MKKILISVLLLGTVGFVQAAEPSFRVPVSGNNIADTNMQASGVEKAIIAFSTTPLLAVDSSSNAITSGLIYWVIRPSTAGVGQYLELRATNTANVTSQRLIPRIPAVSTAAIGGAGFTGQVIEFDPPIPFYTGLSYNLVPIGIAPTTAEVWTIGVRRRN